jgi:hypothetical protein
MNTNNEYRIPNFGKDYYCFKDKQQNLTKEKCNSCEYSEQRNGYILCYYQEESNIYKNGEQFTKDYK